MGKVENRENALTGIELVIREFLSEDAIGKWYSIRERSLGNLIKQVGLDSSFSMAIYEELKNAGLIEKEGERISMRYKVITNVIPDIRSLAEKIYELKLEIQRTAKKQWFESRKGDCVPPRQRTISMEDFECRSMKKCKGVVKKELLRIPHLGEIVYALADGKITEAKIVCLRFGDCGKVLVDFITPIIKHTDLTDEVMPDLHQNCSLKEIAFSVEELVKRLCENVQKFEKRNK